jgi:hypothetical protein
MIVIFSFVFVVPHAKPPLPRNIRNKHFFQAVVGALGKKADRNQNKWQGPPSLRF